MLEVYLIAVFVAPAIPFAYWVRKRLYSSVIGNLKIIGALVVLAVLETILRAPESGFIGGLIDNLLVFVVIGIIVGGMWVLMSSKQSRSGVPKQSGLREFTGGFADGFEKGRKASGDSKPERKLHVKDCGCGYHEEFEA